MTTALGQVKVPIYNIQHVCGCVRLRALSGGEKGVGAVGEEKEIRRRSFISETICCYTPGL